MILSIWLWACIIGLGYVAFHGGHGTANWRRSRAAGNRNWVSAGLGLRGPWVNIGRRF